MATGLRDFATRLAKKLRGLSRRISGTEPEIADPWDVRGDPTPLPSVRLLLDEIETSALSVYRSHGLPTRVGQYACSDRSMSWKFVAETLDPEERWELFLANDTGKGWRFASLEDLGLLKPGASPELRKASEILTACRTLRLSLTGQGSTSRAEDIEAAIQLGSGWRMIDLAVARGQHTPLKFGKLRRVAKSRTPDNAP
jgi:hypothetical protein